ncbi:MAG: hypothetical protein ACI4JN_00760 [Ruminococcus sp.]
MEMKKGAQTALYKGTYKIADKIIEISSLFEDIHKLCCDYRTEGLSDYAVFVTQSDIDFERRQSAAADLKEGVKIREFPDSYLETLAVYRKIAAFLIDADTILFHGSVVAVDGEGYLFTAKSGTGKSTHTRLWRQYFGERAVMINDDKPLINISENGEVKVYGTPWDGKHRLSTNTSVPLKAVCILERAKENHIEKISKESAYAMLLQQTNRPADPRKIAKTLVLLDRLAENTGLYRLGCNMDIEAAVTAYNGMKG